MSSPPKKFQDMEESRDEYQPSLSPVPQRMTKATESSHRVQSLEVFQLACQSCKKGKRDCEVNELGAACAGCKARKYGCDHMEKKNLRMMEVVRPISNSEESEESEEVVEERKRRK